MGVDTYLVRCDVGNGGTPGAPVLHVAALVVVPAGRISGHAEITQAIAPPDDRLVISDLTGHIRSLEFGDGVRVVTLAGTYVHQLPPPAIGEATLNFSATLVLAQETWEGRGSFTYGAHEVKDVAVTQAPGDRPTVRPLVASQRE